MRAKELVKEYVTSHKLLYILAVISIIFSNIIQVFFPKVLGMFTDDLEHGGLDIHAILKYSLWLATIGILYVGMFGIGQYIVIRLGRGFEFFARQKLFLHFTTLSERYFAKRGTGALLSHVMNDVTAVRESISMGITQTTNASFLIVFTLLMMFLSAIPWYLIVTCMLPIGCIPFFVTTIGPRIRRRSLQVQEALATMTEAAEEQFGGMRVTKTFAVEGIASRRFADTVEQIVKNQLRLVRLSSMFQALLPFLGAFSFVVAILFGGYETIRQRITLGTFVEFTLYLRMISGPLMMIGAVINMTHRSRASADRLNGLLAELPDITDTEDVQPLPAIPLGLEIRNLTFTYPEAQQPALTNIEVSLAPGKTLGIVGRTGSGKTTLAKLLLRLYNPPVGTVFIAGKDILHVTLESLRTNIGYVPQDGFLFSTTIRDNIAFSNREARGTDVAEAAKQAQMYDTIMEFPDDFNTKLGERGVTLSGGQRQRVSLARGFLKQAPILILDDSVSAVDTVTEQKILEQIRNIRAGKTTIIISHRLSAVQHADEIIVLEKGKIIERGTHSDLLAEKGLYATLHAIQEEGVAHAE